MREFPGDAVQPASAAVLKIETKVLLLEYLAGRAQHDATHPENRLGIALTERVQRIELVHQPLVDLLRRQPDGEFEPRLGNIAADVVAYRLGKPGAEGIEMELRQ